MCHSMLDFIAVHYHALMLERVLDAQLITNSTSVCDSSSCMREPLTSVGGVMATKGRPSIYTI